MLGSQIQDIRTNRKFNGPYKMFGNKRRRERREYLAKREQEQKEQELESKKNKVADILDNNKQVPYHMKSEALSVLNEMIYSGKVEEEETRLPKVMVTHSREPSSQLLQFTKQLSLIVGGQHFIRGSTTEAELSELCVREEYTCVIIIHENRGSPSGMVVSMFPYGPTLYFTIIKYSCPRREHSISPKSYLICDNMEGKIGKSVKKWFSLLFPQVENAKRIVSIVNRNDRIAFRHYHIEKKTRIELKNDFSVDLKLFEIRQGTFEMKGEIEWASSIYTNSSKHKEVIGAGPE